MNARKLSLLCPLLAACTAAPDVAPTIRLPAGTSTIALTVAGVHSDKGNIMVSLFNAPDGFPGASPIIDGEQIEPAQEGSMQFTFSNLPAGTYANEAIHDEDGDGHLNKPLIGPPSEGYGVTNNNLPATSAPAYDAAKFDLGEGQTVSLTINLKY